MLVLTRKEGETIVIGDPAAPLGTIKVVDIRGDRVRLGIDFPRDVAVHRQEVVDQILAEGKRPTKEPPPPAGTGEASGG